MEKSTQLGMNRTGADMSPIHSKAMLKGQSLFKVGPIDSTGMAAIRSSYVQLKEPVGSVPLPGTFKGVLTSGKEKMTGHNPEVLINKLGERLAFERSGVRLYDALIMKIEADKADEGKDIVSINLLKQFREEEYEHFLMVKEVMESVGADPTAQTPDADVAGLAALGIQKVMTEPRTSLSQCLEALLTAEMTDNGAWELLVELCEEMGLDDTSAEFRRALAQEEKHLEQIKSWVRQLTMGQAEKAL
ncbi:ferritin-like domain-containing protein [Marinobacter salicampi]|uniref:ferritin-like domain-containing protein n=1 Tax=Marinobacter salicampi TaxID=435907 RepID=UPI00140A398B|nr:ferritin-like domain-containing protein [Marinobacter salicampi]